MIKISFFVVAARNRVAYNSRHSFFRASLGTRQHTLLFPILDIFTGDKGDLRMVNRYGWTNVIDGKFWCSFFYFRSMQWSILKRILRTFSPLALFFRIVVQAFVEKAVGQDDSLVSSSVYRGQ